MYYIQQLRDYSKAGNYISNRHTMTKKALGKLKQINILGFEL